MKSFWTMVGPVSFATPEERIGSPTKDFSSNSTKFIRSELRFSFLRSKLRNECLKRARHGKGLKCNLCSGFFKKGQVHVDHIVPVGRFKDWDTYVNRLFCDVDGLQVLCIPCHKGKTKVDLKNI